MNENNIENKKWFGWVIVLTSAIFIVFAGAIAYFFIPGFSQPTSYVIQTVPYVGMHNNVNEYRRPYSRNDAGAAVISVLEYWNPGENDISEVDTYFNQIEDSRTITYNDVVSYVNGMDEYFAETVSLSLHEISEYIYEYKTPLIVSFPITVNQSSSNPYHPARVLVGVDYENRTLTFHGYWTGAYTEVSFREWKQMQAQYGNTDDETTFVAISPIDRDETILAIENREVDYFSPEIDIETKELFEVYALASGARYVGENEEAAEHYAGLVKDPNFDVKIHPSDRIIALSRYVEVLNALERYEDALEYGEQVRNQNENLNEAFRYFGPFDYLYQNNAPGYQDRLSLPHIVSGDTFRYLGRTAEAIEQYQTALEIYPRHISIPGLIEELQAE